MKKKLFNSRIIVTTHVYGTGASQDLVRFLTHHKTRKVMFIGHPLFYDKHLEGSGYTVFESGQQTHEVHTQHRPTPLFVSFAIHIIRTLLWTFDTKDTWDIFVGSNNLNAFTGLILRRLGKVKRVVYYVIDYNPQRYANKFVNGLYHWLDRYCVLGCDETWNLSPRMEEGRKTYFNFSGGRQKLVPVGMWKQSLAHVSMTQIQKHTAVFLGHILKKQGIGYVISAIPEIKKRIPDFTFLILGGGEYMETLKKQAQELHVDSYITFTGFIADHAVIEDKLSHCALGIAIYDRKDNGKLNFSYFSSPTKVKAYLAAGLPVLMSDVPYNAREMEREGCGNISTTDPDDIARRLVHILTHQNVLEKMRTNVVRYRKRFDWDVIFLKAFENLS